MAWNDHQTTGSAPPLAGGAETAPRPCRDRAESPSALRVATPALGLLVQPLRPGTNGGLALLLPRLNVGLDVLEVFLLFLGTLVLVLFLLVTVRTVFPFFMN